jgi:eukaryotic-like serine/threonine-protein kinase
MHQVGSPQLGDVVAGRYRLIRVLGQGGFGSVFEVADEQGEGNHLALKLLRPDQAKDARMRARFEREVRIAKSVQCAHVPKVVESGVWELAGEEPVPFLAMTLAKGVTLAHRVLANGGLSLNTAYSILEQLCRGLSAVHERGFVHRDLSPENVMVEPSGNVMILDFGLSSAGHGAIKITSPGQVVGSLGYMAPEQARGEEVDERADVYSAAAVFFFMLFGKPPIEGESVAVSMRRLISDTAVSVPSLPLLAENISPDAMALVRTQLQWGLAKEARERTPTVREFAERMKEAVQSASNEEERERASVPEVPLTDAAASAALAEAKPQKQDSDAPLSERSESGAPITERSSDAGQRISDSAANATLLSIPAKATDEPSSPALALRSDAQLDRVSTPPTSTRASRSLRKTQSTDGSNKTPSKSRVVLMWVVIALAAIGLGILLALR